MNSTATSSALEVRDLHFSYQTQSKTQKKGSDALTASEVLKGLSFKIAFGCITGLLGPNGSGKSTSFKILSTQMLPSRGSAFINGIDVVKEASKARLSLGVTFQSPSLDPMLTIHENLTVHAALMGLSKSEGRTRIESRLKGLMIWDRKDSRVKELSGGLARRAELAKTLLADPQVLLLDEPTTGLDPSSRREFWKLLRALVSPRTAILVTTHLMEEAELCDELIFISDGSVAAQGSPDALKKDFGAEVLLLEGVGLEALQDSVARFVNPNVRVSLQGHALRLEGTDLSRELERVRSEYAQALTGFHWSRGTLADVYLSKTGKELVAT
ncbi:MAG: ABC transporter ATP-binding protein [Bdellovibrionota bacterium]